MTWISVKDKLPEEDEIVILFNNIFGITIGYLWIDKNPSDEFHHSCPICWMFCDIILDDTSFEFGSRYSHFDDKEVLMWMPLPEIPKGIKIATDFKSEIDRRKKMSKLFLDPYYPNDGCVIPKDMFPHDSL